MSILLQLVQDGGAVSDSLSSTTSSGGALDVLNLIWKGGIVNMEMWNVE